MPHRGAEGKVLTGECQAPSRSIAGTCNGQSNEQARVTKPSLPLALAGGPAAFLQPPPPFA